MNFQTFRTTFKDYPIISKKEIEKLFTSFDAKNLVNWQQKNYIQKVRNEWYRLTENPLDPPLLYFISNHIYHPSYISLETALAHYGFIPEGVFRYTAISTLKTQNFDTPIGLFNYNTLKSNLFFGYNLLNKNDFYYKIADPQKCLLDFFYLHPDIQTEGHFYELRMNILDIKKQIDFELLKKYTFVFDSKALTKRITTFIHFIENN
jgi:predicted transcriptional regulator of viral defense system